MIMVFKKWFFKKAILKALKNSDFGEYVTIGDGVGCHYNKKIETNLFKYVKDYFDNYTIFSVENNLWLLDMEVVIYRNYRDKNGTCKTEYRYIFCEVDEKSKVALLAKIFNDIECNVPKKQPKNLDFLIRNKNAKQNS